MGLVTSARGALNEWTSPSAIDVQSAVVHALESACVQEAPENESQVWGTLPAGSLPEAASQIDEQQRQQLLLDHLPQVRHVARRIHFRLPPQVLLEDLVHAGVLGLIDAVRKYDPSKNVQPKYYAEFRIRGAILDSLRLADWSPRALRRRARRLDQAISRCRSQLGRDPSELEIAAEMQISLESLQRLVGDIRGLNVGSLQHETEDTNQEKKIQDRVSSIEEDPYRQTLRSEMMRLLEQGIEELPGREREVLALYHFQELTMKQVGALLGIGESRVSQIHTAAMARLRSRVPELLARNSRSSKPGPQRAIALLRRKPATEMGLSSNRA
jgi:RNA polymerase sigma factor FliA